MDAKTGSHPCFLLEPQTLNSTHAVHIGAAEGHGDPDKSREHSTLQGPLNIDMFQYNRYLYAWEKIYLLFTNFSHISYSILFIFLQIESYSLKGPRIAS